MESPRARLVETGIGRQEVDRSGSPVGVVRLDVNKSYGGMGKLLQAHINETDEGAWREIRRRIDYTYESLDSALGMLDRETRFTGQVRNAVGQGAKLLFKPNLVTPMCIDPQTHGPDMGSLACTEWAFVAALMRWFHDKVGIRYHEMALGEAATAIPAAARFYSRLMGAERGMTPEAVIEGRSGAFYGGWGFYFARKYLAESLRPGDADDPMRGYEESVHGTYLPPGEASDRLMVYDLNRLYDDPRKGREIEVPDGINYRRITIHKAVAGGDPGDPEDRRAYPGCVLVNVPKLKVHMLTLLTGVIKNLGIGLYPMQHANSGGMQWDYGVPPGPVPAMKGGIPHQIWVPEIDTETWLPRRDGSGDYAVTKTGGITATMIDIIQAVRHAGIFMIHVVDGIEAINWDHTGLMGTGNKEPEGIVFAGLDPVATDLLCARYMFCNVPLEEAASVDLDDGHGGRFPQKVPVPTVHGTSIVTRQGYDCPLCRDTCFQEAERRGLGQRRYYAVGRDVPAQSELVSVQGHLGRISDGRFSDVITKSLFYDNFKLPWDLQKTALSYLEAVDKRFGSSRKQEFLAAYDEDGDGVVTYEEFGRKGITGPLLYLLGNLLSRIGDQETGLLRLQFNIPATVLKLMDPAWNPHGHDLFKEYNYGLVCKVAYQMSLLELELPDPFAPDLTWGNGKWPSFDLAKHVICGMFLYGEQYPDQIQLPSMYGFAFCHADLTQNGGAYVGRIRSEPDLEGLGRYVREVTDGRASPLDFTLYVPPGFDSLTGGPIPNVEVLSDQSRAFTASFAGGSEVWSPIGP